MRGVKTIVHIGLHKTGSTSLQSFLWQNRDRLAELGFALFKGKHIPQNHVELHIAAMAPERLTPVKISKGIQRTKSYRSAVERRLETFFSTAPNSTYIFSSEGLSYLREREELDWLQSILPGEVVIIAYIRNLTDYMQRYGYMLRRMGIPTSGDPASIAYIAPDSWLFDYQSRINAFLRCFGSDKVITIDYDTEFAKSGNIIPSFLRALEIESKFSPQDWNGIFLNKSPHGLHAQAYLNSASQ